MSSVHPKSASRNIVQIDEQTVRKHADADGSFDVEYRRIVEGALAEVSDEY
jgi:hypothetical protein